MQTAPNRLDLIEDVGEIPEYPISASDRLDSHYFIQWNLRRWDDSDFRKAAYKDPEVGFFGLELIFRAHKGTPVGTLSCDDETLAFNLHLSLERWLALKKRVPSPLHNWTRALCDNGEIRFAHPVVTEVAKEALKSKQGAAEKAERRKVAKRLKDLAAMVERVGAGQVLKQAGLIDRLDGWLAEHCTGNRTEQAVREALDAVAV